MSVSESPTTSTGKRKRGRRRGVYYDENAPRRPCTAYLLYINVRRKEMEDSGQHEQLRRRTLMREMAEEWKNLSDELKKPYVDQSAKDYAQYWKDMEEYKKTEAYSQFQVKRKELSKQRKAELKKRKMKAKGLLQEEEKDATANVDDIPIFSKEFLAYNKAQESKCKKLRQMVSTLQEERDLLKANIAKLSEKVGMIHGHHLETTQWATKMKQRWTKLLVDALAYVSVDGENPTAQNIDIYMQKLKKLVTENPNNKDLIAVRMALSEVNFT